MEPLETALVAMEEVDFKFDGIMTSKGTLGFG